MELSNNTARLNTLTVEDNELDKFGIIKIQKKTKDNHQEWYIHDKMNTDSRIKFSSNENWNLVNSDIWEGHPNPDGNTRTARININTTNPDAYNVEKQLEFGKDFKKLAERGFMIDENDFRNFELTTYFKITHILRHHNEGKMTGYGRGGRHSDEGWPNACLATCYKGVFSVRDKASWFEKEYHHHQTEKEGGHAGYSYHLNEKKFEDSKIDIGNGINNWIGLKFIVYDIDNRNSAKCELWYDKNSDKSISDTTKQSWVKINEIEDKGNNLEGDGPQALADQMKEHCNCDSDKFVFKWGGPTVTWRIDDCIVQHTKTSIREIIPQL